MEKWSRDGLHIEAMLYAGSNLNRALAIFINLVRNLMQGTVKWFNSQKGYEPTDGGKDVFVHISVVERAGMNGLNEGQQVFFDIITDRKNGKTSAGNLRTV